jgi:hypothetical protein
VGAVVGHWRQTVCAQDLVRASVLDAAVGIRARGVVTALSGGIGLAVVAWRALEVRITGELLAALTGATLAAGADNLVVPRNVDRAGRTGRVGCARRVATKGSRAASGWARFISIQLKASGADEVDRRAGAHTAV